MVKIERILLTVLLCVIAFVGFKYYDEIKRVQQLASKVLYLEQKVEAFTQTIDKYKKLLDNKKIFGDEGQEPRIVYQTQTEYLILPQDTVVKKTLDPLKIPVTKEWHLKGITENVGTLTKHLVSSDEHQVPAELIEGWTLEQLRRLHSYLHNGYSLDGLE